MPRKRAIPPSKKNGGIIMSNQYDDLALNHHLSFLLYSGSKETIRSFTPLLEQLDLTYTQYLTMLIIWEHGQLLSQHSALSQPSQ